VDPGSPTPDSDPGLPGMTLIQPISKNTTLDDLTRQIIYSETNKLSASHTVNVVQD